MAKKQTTQADIHARKVSCIPGFVLEIDLHCENPEDDETHLVTSGFGGRVPVVYDTANHAWDAFHSVTMAVHEVIYCGVHHESYTGRVVRVADIERGSMSAEYFYLLDDYQTEALRTGAEVY